MVKLMVTPTGEKTSKEEKEDFPIETMLDARQRNGFPENKPVQDDQIEEVAERMLGRIDRRISILRDLIEKADQRIETMQNPGYVLPAEFPGSGEKSLSDRRRGAAGTRRNADGNKSFGHDRRTRIVSLHRRGIPTDKIAREVKMGQGEVELILKVEGYDT